VTTLAPLPGRATEPDDEGGAAPAQHEGITVAETVPAGARRRAPDTIDLTRPRVRPPAGDHAAQASWVFGLALALLSEGAGERAAMAEVLAEAAGRSRALEGAYGRGVALLSEYPGDPLVQSTVDLLAKALLRSRRPARPADEA
jgi:hypothetical protein